MDKLKIAYFGSPDFAADFLEKLITDSAINQSIEVKLVVTQPDQKVGRKQILTPTPVKMIASKYLKSEDIKFFSLSGLGVPAVIKNFGVELLNIDLALVYAYGDLIPKEFLTLPKYGFWNIHPSLLPKYRGPSPIATPLINGDKTTGVTIIKMDDNIDHGPIIAQETYTIKDSDYRPDLEKELTNLAFMMFKKTVIQLTGSRVNELMSKPQNDRIASYTKKLTKQDGFVSFENLIPIKSGENSPEVLYNLFRGLYPWPGIWTILPNGKRLKITQLKMKNEKLIIEKVQLEGKKEVDFKVFNTSYKLF